MKTHSFSPPRAFAILFCSFGLLACEPPPEPGEPQVLDPKQQAKQAQQLGMLAGKPGAPIEVDYELSGKPMVGQPLEITLTFRSEIPGEALSARYEVSDGSALSLVGNRSRREIIATDERSSAGGRSEDARSVGRDTVQLLPHRQGQHFLTVVAELETETGPISRSVSIPVSVNGAGLQQSAARPDNSPTGELQQDSNGEAVISMPAQDVNAH